MQQRALQLGLKAPLLRANLGVEKRLCSRLNMSNSACCGMGVPHKSSSELVLGREQRELACGAFPETDRAPMGVGWLLMRLGRPARAHKGAVSCFGRGACRRSAARWAPLPRIEGLTISTMNVQAPRRHMPACARPGNASSQ